jgi:hypothetical protein
LSVTKPSLRPSGLTTLTLAPATGVPVPSRVTHTSEPCGESLALMARSVICATAVLWKVRAVVECWWLVYSTKIPIGPRLSLPPSTSSGRTRWVAGLLAAAVGLSVTSLLPFCASSSPRVGSRPGEF